MSLGLVLLSTIVFESFVLRRLRFDPLIVVIVLAGTVLYVDYLSYTSVGERNYDGTSHVEYVQSIAATLHLPDALSCIACGHPPLYYALAALWSALAPFCLGYATVVVRLRRYSKPVHHAGIALALVMIAVSVAFFARPYPT